MRPSVCQSATRAAMVALLTASVVGGCTGASSTASPAVRTDTASVQVSLQEWSIVSSETILPAGPVNFVVYNNGPDAPHELVILRTDLDPGELPTRSNGLVDETGDGLESVGRIEELDVGASESATIVLTPGRYVLICNIDYYGAHYTAGMHTAITIR